MAKLFRAGKQMTEALLTVFKYVGDVTGTKPSQGEIANALKSYFILNEIGNQIRFQRKNPIVQEPAQIISKDPFWRLNLMPDAPKNNLTRVGLFYENIHIAIKTAQNFVKESSGSEPSEAEIAASLKSSFILSEIKNQIAWQRQRSQTANPEPSQTRLN